MLFLVDHPISFYFESKPSSISKEERKVKKKKKISSDVLENKKLGHSVNAHGLTYAI